MLILCLFLQAKAQQDPYFSHFKHNQQFYNAAAIASKPNMFCINMVSHKQWHQFDDRTPLNREPGKDPRSVIESDVAPVTHNLNFYGPMRINGSWSSKWFVGGVLLSDQINQFQSTVIGFNAAHRMEIDNQSNINLGVSVRMEELALNKPNFIPRQLLDPHIPTPGTQISDENLDFSLAVYYQKRSIGRFRNNYIGLSLQHIPQLEYKLQTFDFNQVHHWYLNAGTRILLRPYWLLEPAILLKKGVVTQAELNATLVYKSQYRLGTAYRRWSNADAISLFLGYIAKVGSNKNSLQMGYSYDFTTSKIRTVSRGTHEIMLSCCLPLETRWYRNTRSL